MALRSSIIALRIGGVDVIAFKAAIDELSRLAAGRAEDEALLLQLEARLSELDGGVSRRLLMECHFRDEWRHAESERVLGTLPSLLRDAGAVDQMRDYVALLAPEEESEPERSQMVQSWQRELTRQQRTLASLLKYCPEASAGAIRDVLSDFMALSQARLQAQLDIVNDQLQGSSNDSPSAETPTSSAPALLNVSAEDFVQRLRVQHDAICKIQACFRGSRQLARYEQLQATRKSAAMRIQRLARRGAALREVRSRRRLQWLGRLDTLTRGYQARRLQQAWRWAKRNYHWRSVWLLHHARSAAAADVLWRAVLVSTQSIGRREDATGFSKYSVYIESRAVKERKQAEEAATIKIQAAARALATRHAARKDAVAATQIGAAWRGKRARSRELWWRKTLSKLHKERRAICRWKNIRDMSDTLAQFQTRAVLVQLNVSKELAHVKQETIREKEEFEHAFRKWAAKMEKQTLSKKLHADWIPQMNVGSGESYYFNVRTGESSEEHPNMRQVRATEKKQRALAEATMTERLKHLRSYEEQLVEARDQQMELYREQVEEAWRVTTPWSCRQASYACK
ncbi:MAG: hypothetical protein SGPRY_003578 [Prymnesium sp.]